MTTLAFNPVVGGWSLDKGVRKTSRCSIIDGYLTTSVGRVTTVLIQVLFNDKIEVDDKEDDNNIRE